ncbi:MAG TPA: biotin/lipoyl-binding protein [Candidatus Sulfotelmatobacter sp.]|nr:biotin/lipoyl-binding protein [Candidatus Sulfotelmatobacter sp.]
MKNKIIFALSLLGLLAGTATAYFFTITKQPLPPVFSPASNPYDTGVYAEGIVESVQASGENINIYPEVAGTVTEILVAEGQVVKKGMPLLLIDDSIQKATTLQQKSASEAARAMLEELRAEPRPETLQIVESQVEAAQASLRTAQDTLSKQKTAYEMNPKSISRDALDNAINAEAVAQANLEVARKQRDLTKAGAWSFDIRNQERQYNALEKSYFASTALLSKYTLRAPSDGIVLTINSILGSYVSPQGAYESYTQGMNPVLVLGTPQTNLHVRCYIDEILVPRLPTPSNIKAQMSIRGTNVKISLEFVRIQPFVSPKIQLSDQRQERVDVRVLPVIFSFTKPKDLNVYPGELVDVYIGH